MSETHHVCPAERAGFLTGRLRSMVHNPERILAQYVKKGAVVVDIGCGPGFFTCPVAEMAGEEGRVIAVDLQEEMLQKLRQRAGEKGLLSRIELCRADVNSLNVNLKGEADFVLAFYMVHEVPDKEALFTQIYDILKSGGRILIIEPAFHVGKGEFKQTLDIALTKGLEIIESSEGIIDLKALLVKTG
ncbi:MAG: class I SAM-dependent methyltransferase [Methanomicrobiaceae archaeon]|nr:class I SAM-dependent methyltransferase [Methanomicrobiaceae archaeon]